MSGIVNLVFLLLVAHSFSYPSDPVNPCAPKNGMLDEAWWEQNRRIGNRITDCWSEIENGTVVGDFPTYALGFLRWGNAGSHGFGCNFTLFQLIRPTVEAESIFMEFLNSTEHPQKPFHVKKLVIADCWEPDCTFPWRNFSHPRVLSMEIRNSSFCATREEFDQMNQADFKVDSSGNKCGDECPAASFPGSFDQCEMGKGDVLITANSTQQLSDFARLRGLNGSLIIRNTSIATLRNAFPNLTRITGSVKIENNAELTDYGSILDTIVPWRSISLNNNGKKGASGIPKPTFAQQMRIHKMNIDMEGRGWLKTCGDGDFTVRETYLNMMDCEIFVGNLQLTNHTILPEARFLRSIRHITGELRVTDVDRLVTFKYIFTNLESIGWNGLQTNHTLMKNNMESGLVVVGNSNMRKIDFPNLKLIGGNSALSAKNYTVIIDRQIWNTMNDEEKMKLYGVIYRGGKIMTTNSVNSQSSFFNANSTSSNNKKNKKDSLAHLVYSYSSMLTIGVGCISIIVLIVSNIIILKSRAEQCSKCGDTLTYSAPAKQEKKGDHLCSVTNHIFHTD